MKFPAARFCLPLLIQVLLFSCSSLPVEAPAAKVPAEAGPEQAGTAPPAEKPPEEGPQTVPEAPLPRTRPEQLSRSRRGGGTAAVPERPPEPVPPPPPVPEDVPILGQGKTAEAVLEAFLLSVNPQAGELAGRLARFYVEEAAAEGINHDVAFAQMCLETGFLRFGGLVTADMNNFCGLGSIGPGQPGERFPEALIGVRAHIQHLKVYAADTPLNRELVDPRYRFVRPGTAPTIRLLAGTWAADRQYGDKITGILERLYAFSAGKTPPLRAELVP